MHNSFEFHDNLIEDYKNFSTSFTKFKAPDIKTFATEKIHSGKYWPDPLVQVNVNYKRARTVEKAVLDHDLHPVCDRIFRFKKGTPESVSLTMYTHQEQAIDLAKSGKSYVVTTGTGSGKSLTFFIPMVDAILRDKERDPSPRTRAIIIYPMNALANSQAEEFKKFLDKPVAGDPRITVERYTGQEDSETRRRIAANPPDILLTNYMMLELLLTRHNEQDSQVIENCTDLRFLVLDELHTYRGRQGADVAVLVRRLKQRTQAEHLLCIGTSATMSSQGSQSERSKVVARVASKLFGAKITENEIIGETLERLTDPQMSKQDAIRELPGLLSAPLATVRNFNELAKHPLAVWLELTLGMSIKPGERPQRAAPLPLWQLSDLLAADSGLSSLQAQEVLKAFLLQIQHIKTNDDRSPFAFRLHQFVSAPGKLLSTLEAPGERYLTLDDQVYAPNGKGEGILLYDLHFCRTCGQEYIPVWKQTGAVEQFLPRKISETPTGDEDENEMGWGFLCPNSEEVDFTGAVEEYPESWINFSKNPPELKSDRKKRAMALYTLSSDGRVGSGASFWYAPLKHTFCLACKEEHEGSGKDLHRLTSLSGEGRSSATTMLSLSGLTHLYRSAEGEQDSDYRKILAFTDNRQDAALQAGHFNDFLDLLTFRAALLASVKNKGVSNLNDLPGLIFNALGFNTMDLAILSEYLQSTQLSQVQLAEAQSSLRLVFGYRLLVDLRRGWRYNNPNLEQLDLINIGYRGLEDLCEDEAAFSGDAYLRQMDGVQRAKAMTILLDYLRSKLAIQSRYLDGSQLEKAKNASNHILTARWGMSVDERLRQPTTLVMEVPSRWDSRRSGELIRGGARSGLVRNLKRGGLFKGTLAEAQARDLKLDDWASIADSLVRIATQAGLLLPVPLDNKLQGWRLRDTEIEWRVRDQDSGQSNRFFRELYQKVCEDLRAGRRDIFGFEGQEHTAQVESSDRQELEGRFRYAKTDRDEYRNAHPGQELRKLPLMYCSPTMELGVDISALNTVYMRNVPPTPANYAQRSGRAGRSGQQALVLTYCAGQSPHDQWFFEHQDQMVHGAVQAPALDLNNRELWQSHLNAIWLSEARFNLPGSAMECLDMGKPGYPVKEDIRAILTAPGLVVKAVTAGTKVGQELIAAENGDPVLYSPVFVQQAMQDAFSHFERAFDRWRSLYRSTLDQMRKADAIQQSHTHSRIEKDNATTRYNDAVRQRRLLEAGVRSDNADFSTYRYLATQGFLPGYNFPRLPLMAWIPAGGKAAKANTEGSMVSRPRFLALSEFGPRSLIYHQGKTYRVVRAKLGQASGQATAGSELPTQVIKVCSTCGFFHPGTSANLEPAYNNCQSCGAPLGANEMVQSLYKIETVETRLAERISADEEERQRQGFELQTSFRYAQRNNGTWDMSCSSIRSADGSCTLAELRYGPSATLWRINKGWRRRKDQNVLGFHINPLTGWWSKQEKSDEAAGAQDESENNGATARIVPYVEDVRNILVLMPSETELEDTTMATLTAALKRAVESLFQIEESELVAESLPDSKNRKAILFYEAAEGGAGVLSQLAHDPTLMPAVARKALEIMHYDLNGVNSHHELLDHDQAGAGAAQPCESGCYRCLLSYFNQPDHVLIDRKNEKMLEILWQMAQAEMRLGECQGLSSPVQEQEESDLAGMLRERLRSECNPSEWDKEVKGIGKTALAHYKEQRVMVFAEALSESEQAYLKDKGYRFAAFTEDGDMEISLKALNELLQEEDL